MADKVRIAVSARVERFRRAGMEFTTRPRAIQVDKETLEVLKAEPMLIVDKAKEGAAGKDKAGAGGKR